MSHARPLRLALAWLLALLLPLQGLAAPVLMAMGPSHVHRAVEPAPAQVLSAFGHFHSAKARHHHAITDATVLHVAGDDAVEHLAVSPALAAFVAMPQPSADWHAEPAAACWVAHPAWACLTHDPDTLERPPRRA